MEGRQPQKGMMVIRISAANRNREAGPLAWIWERARNCQLERPEGFTKTFF